jgi:hypothetical protein
MYKVLRDDLTWLGGDKAFVDGLQEFVSRFTGGACGHEGN